MVGHPVHGQEVLEDLLLAQLALDLEEEGEVGLKEEAVVEHLF